MNTQSCPHCGQPVLPLADSAQDIPKTDALAKSLEVLVEEKVWAHPIPAVDRIGWFRISQLRPQSVELIDFYPEGA